MLTTDPFLRPWTGAPAVLALDVAVTQRPPRRTRDGRLVGSAIRPSAALRANYEARLRRLVDEMDASVRYWLAAAYRRQEDRIGALGLDAYIMDSSFAGGLGMGDESTAIVEPLLRRRYLAVDARPSVTMEEAVRRLRRRWVGRFDDAALDLARYFAKAIWQRSDADLRRILKKAGITVEFKVSQQVRDALAAIVHENVSLIKSIPQQYLTSVEGSVMRSVLAGRDLESLTVDLRHQHGLARERAELIALHQNNSASGAIQRLQYIDLGIERAIWHHSHAGVTPRRSHLANDGKEFDVKSGWYDPDEGQYIRPGQLINCRCFSSPILPR